ncbi:MAG TPA: hypothetical protein VH206_07240 [Xanthobacteraceae bacterium]|jgi:hypothetical protein|nr:hypothetical protein [Xanthobacteraceae bacterium]
MARPARLSESANSVDGERIKAAVAKATEGDVLHFLSRTLQAHFLDARPEDIVEKLRNLKQALEQQEATMTRWPDSPAKERMCAALAKARKLVSQIADDVTAPTDGEEHSGQ